MKKFEVEIEGKPTELIFRNPTVGERDTWIDFQKEIREEALPYEGKEDQHVEEGLKILRKLDGHKDKYLINLCTSGNLSEEKIQKMAYSDRKILHDWFNEKVGLKVGGETANFSKT